MTFLWKMIAKILEHSCQNFKIDVLFFRLYSREYWQCKWRNFLTIQEVTVLLNFSIILKFYKVQKKAYLTYFWWVKQDIDWNSELKIFLAKKYQFRKVKCGLQATDVAMQGSRKTASSYESQISCGGVEKITKVRLFVPFVWNIGRSPIQNT